MGYKTTKILELRIQELINELIKKSQEIKEKNLDITTGIRYAQKIQQAILPPIFKNTFVLYMPKDLVSGDFYWMSEVNNHKIIAAVDCTGHGVPGAFMSIIGYTSLNKLILQNKILNPAEILNHLSAEISLFLQEGLDDGMDISIISISNNKLHCAAGNHSIYLVRNGEIITFKGDRLSIGLTTHQLKKTFTDMSYKIQENDMIYMMSDGYGDQFSSKSLKKFQTSNIKKLLLQICHLTIEEQQETLHNEILNWQGDEMQTDDIMLIGIKI